jgi:spermidine synthase
MLVEKNGSISIQEVFDGFDFCSFGVQKVICSIQTKFQTVDIVDTYSYGRILHLDNTVQSAEYDEYIYHEALVHPVLANLKNAKKVLIVGGGEGATAREVLKYSNVEKLDMVDIDGELVEICKEYLPSWSDGAFADPRLNLVIQDALEFIKKSDELYDFIIVDLVDPADIKEDSPARAIYEGDFFDDLSKHLSVNGAMVVQSAEFNQGEFASCGLIHRKVRNLFKHCEVYKCFVPSFISEWGFIACSQTQSFKAIKPEEVDANIAVVKVIEDNKVSGVAVETNLDNELEFYDGMAHQALFTLSKDLRRLIENDFIETEEVSALAV